MQKLKNKPSLFFMIAHAVLVIIWNLVGVWLLSNGQSALGPTATLSGALIFAVLIIIYTFSYQKGFKTFYFTIIAIGALLGAYAIYGAVTKDSSLWPSEFWRYTGIAVNLLGIIGLLLFFKKSKN